MNIYSTIFYCISCSVLLHGALGNTWEGSYSDNLFGGSLEVCVSTLQGGANIGQGVISNVGFLIGNVEGNVWQGEYTLAGIESRAGSFFLIRDSSGYSGNFTDFSVGSTRSALLAVGVKTSDVTPDDAACFRIDDEVLHGNVVPSFRGSWTGAVSVWNIYDREDTDYITSSYSYTYDGGSAALGWEFGNKRSTRGAYVATTNFYENGVSKSPYNGIDLLVAKSATAFYSTYWNFQRIADFDYSRISEPNFHVQGLNTRISNSVISQKQADTNICYSLYTAAAQSSCVKSQTTSKPNVKPVAKPTAKPPSKHTAHGKHDGTKETFNWIYSKFKLVKETF